VPDRIDRRSFLSRGLLAAGGVAAAGGAGAVLGACGSGGPSGATGGARNGITTSTPRQGGVLNFGVEAEEQGFDPATGRFDETGVQYARTVFDPLTILAADGTVQPYLAQSVTPNGDYSQWTITARPGVLFHDGTTCDAAAIAGSIEHFIHNLLGVTFNTVSNISVPDSSTVVISLKQSWVPFPAYLAGGIGGQPGYIIAPSMISNPNGSKQPVGTGPFRFKEWVPNDHFTAVRNPNYWRKGLPYVDQVTYHPITDPQQRANSLQAGNINIMHTTLPESILQFRDDTSYSYVDDSQHIVGEPDMNFIMINTQDPTMSDIRIRQAMAMAVNPRQYAQVIDKGVAPPTNQPFVPGTPYYVADAGYPSYNPSAAKALVQAIERDTGKPVSFTLQSGTSASDLQSVQFLQNQLQQVGFKINLQQIQQADQINNALAGLFQATTWRQFAAVDPDLNYLWWSPTEIFGTGPSAIASNFARNADPEIEALLQEGRQQTNPSVRALAYQGVAKQLNKDLPYIWTDRTIWAIVSDPNVQNFNNPSTPAGAKAYGMMVGTVWASEIWIS
jgi:peptide/nickel transport system substrate-binding protein